MKEWEPIITVRPVKRFVKHRKVEHASTIYISISHHDIIFDSLCMHACMLTCCLFRDAREQAHDHHQERDARPLFVQVSSDGQDQHGALRR